jgi:hypothetical protein
MKGSGWLRPAEVTVLKKTQYTDKKVQYKCNQKIKNRNIEKQSENYLNC